MTQFYSRNDTTFQGDSIFTIPFSYIKQEDINIFVNDELIKDWLWLNETQVSITKELTLGDLISIRRQTPIDEKIVDYQNMSMVLDDNNLNLSQDQNIYSIQELYDNNEQFKINTNETLASDKVELENIIETNRQELLDIQTNFENETNIKFDDYKTELNTKIETVAEAADKINELEEAVDIATEAANVAIDKANEATEITTQANKDMQNKLDEVIEHTSQADINLQEKIDTATQTIDDKIAINDLAMASVLSQTELVLQETKETLSDTLNKSQITNCITEIPQRVKHTLENGTLSLKAGTVLIVPYSTEDLTAQYPIGSTFIHENFKVVDTQYEDGKFVAWVEVQNDIVENKTSTVAMTRYGGVNITSNSMYYMNNLESGTATSSTNTYTIYYNTNTNLVGFAAGTKTISYSSVYAYPVFIGTSSTTTLYNTIDQVFNGMGYIGSTLWVDKGVKGLYPDEFNGDGTYKSIEINTTKLTTITNPFGANPTPNSCMALDLNGSVTVMHRYIESTVEPTTTYTSWYNSTTNKILYAQATAGEWRKQEVIPVASLNWTHVANPRTNTFTSLVPKQPFRAMDYNDYKNTSHITETYVNGTSWYRIWSDGWIEQGLTGVSNHNGTKLTLLKPFSNTNYTIALSRRVNSSYEDTSCTAYPTSKSQITIFGKDDGLRSIYACGY